MTSVGGGFSFRTLCHLIHISMFCGAPEIFVYAHLSIPFYHRGFQYYVSVCITDVIDALQAF